MRIPRATDEDLGFRRPAIMYNVALQDYIETYKAAPEDMKNWPYGPYWPAKQVEIILETPVHSQLLADREPLHKACDDEGKKLNHC